MWNLDSENEKTARIDRDTLRSSYNCFGVGCLSKNPALEYSTDYYV